MIHADFEIRRNSANMKLLEETYDYSNSEIPVIVNNANYWIDGENPEDIPLDYFTNPASMTEFQLKKIKWHEEHIMDNYVPVLHPWYGTTVVPSALGATVLFPENTDPALRGNVVKCPEQVKDLAMPDPYKDGLMPVVLKTID